MKFYVQLTEDNRVTDIIEYAYDGYIEVHLPIPLPNGAISGRYKLIDGKLVYSDEFEPSRLDEIENLMNVVLGVVNDG